jgi:hypothetical protein
MRLPVRELTILELQGGRTAERRALTARARACWVLGGSLEKVCRRTALPAAAIESHAGTGLGLELGGEMTDDPCGDKGCSLERQVTVTDLRYDCRVSRAVLRDRGEVDSVCRPGLHRAMMCAVPSAAGREIRFGAGREGQGWRDQRKAEDEKQDDAENASHSAIVASFVSQCVRDMFAVRNLPWRQRNPAGTRA